MINKTAKGNRKELICKKELEAEGYNVVFKSAHVKYHMVDYANIIDVVGYKGKERKFISCKTVKNGVTYPQHQKEIISFKEEYGLPGESYELWLWTAGRFRGRKPNKIWHEARWEKVIL